MSKKSIIVVIYHCLELLKRIYITFSLKAVIDEFCATGFIHAVSYILL
jgi:hypothetical protein